VTFAAVSATLHICWTQDRRMEGEMQVLQKVFVGIGRSFLPALSMVVLASSVGFAPSALAQKAATATSVKIGYFNLNLVKASYPEAAGSEQIKNQAEEQLKRDVLAGNDKLTKAKEEKKSEDEIKKMQSDLQIAITAKQQALVELVQNANAIAQERMRQAINAVAKDKGLDVVIDGAGVFAGGQRIVENGVDVTEDIVKKLSPGSSNAAQKAATK
jgi:Skp family chaperone for outer membrane proteins